ncbi:hypothetical protein ACEWY4_027398 [Coilia grayii]|uniref:Reverse transcriptase domain-containing protein n=2 Tax=Coilia grayii TaxID=363190 RepID=A0ABD1IPS0_9TELE
MADNYAFRALNWGIRPTPNLEHKEIEALKQLQMNHSIVIKPADKGNSIVIMDRTQYIWEGLRQLNNSDHYKKLEKPIYFTTINLVKNILDNLVKEGYLNIKQRLYLLGNTTPRSRRFYLLPKIHKPKDKWSIPYLIPPGRPIVSDCGSETYEIAEYLEYYLNPLSQKHPSYLKDTYHFIEKLNQITVPSKAFLFTIDIDSLYTNIETKLGLQAIRKCFQKFPDKKRPDNYLLQLLEISLTRNDFEFDGQFYLQVKGTAMGKRFAPSYANIFMADWEESALNNTPLKPLHFFRFLDDIWGVWSNSREDFDTFANYLNTYTDSIKIKHTIHPTEVNFLDTITYKGPKWQTTTHLDTRIYFKDTDTHSLLFKNSYHPKHTYRGIVKSQLLRFHRICSDKEQFYTATITLFKALRQRGYSRTFLRKSLKTFLKVRTRPILEQKILPLVSTYSEPSIQLNRLTRTNFHKFLSNTPFLQKHSPIAAYRRNQNLKDLLVRSTLPPLLSRLSTDHQFFKPKLWVINHHSKHIYKITQTINTQTTNCIYLITCKKCTAQYVGQTKNTILTRLQQHTYNIRNKKETQTHLVKHFLEHGLKSLSITGLQSNAFWNIGMRLTAERQWITNLDTKFPKGLNED